MQARYAAVEQHCRCHQWLVYASGSDGLGSSRQRLHAPAHACAPKLHLPARGHAFRITGFMASGLGVRLQFGRPCCATSIYSSVARFKLEPIDVGPARGLWTSLGRLPLRVFSIGKYAFQKKTIDASAVAEPKLPSSCKVGIRSPLMVSDFGRLRRSNLLNIPDLT
jgi:hypothetical protein